MNPYKILVVMVTAIVLFTGLISCSDKNEHTQTAYKAVAMEAGDECHLCGMLITRFDGPKGELFRQDQQKKVLKFCSTSDMFSYYLDPENKRNVAHMLVHDMSKMPWGSESIDDKYLIDAKIAWYVAGSERKGAMGKTLASFSQKADAQAFAKEFGGQVIYFEQINLALLM